MKRLILLAILLLPTSALADGRKGLAGPGGNNVPGVAQIMAEQGADWFYTWRNG